MGRRHNNNNNKVGLGLILSAVASFGLVSFATCLVAEAKTPKKDDLKVDGKLCYLGGSEYSFGMGIAALICVSIAQITGNLVLLLLLCCCRRHRRTSGTGKATKPTSKPALTAFLLVFSWMSFGVAVMLISAATSMSRTQAYGQGWLDGECYIVRGGVYIISGILSLAAVSALLGACAAATMKRTSTSRTNQVDCTGPQKSEECS